MCGRYRLSRSKELLAEHFDVEPDDEWVPRYNIAPMLIFYTMFSEVIHFQ